jgi:phage terminase large subunit
MIVRTTALARIRSLRRRIRIIQGGASAGKTIAILLILIDYAQRHPGCLISVVSATSPHLRRGAMRDFVKILRELDDYIEIEWNRTNSIYSFDRYGGGQIEFIAIDEYGKARGPRRDVLFVNEANLLSYDIFDQLATRTRDFIIADYNPTRRFWAHTEYLEKDRDDTDFLILTYRDNEALLPSEVQAIESHDRHSNWWRVYGEGQVGEVEGLVYTGWQMVEEIPKTAVLRRYALDFGFSNDPAALVAIYEDEGALYLDELSYKTGILPSQYPGVLETAGVQPEVTIVCDSSRPEIIAELSRAGWSAIPCTKGAGSRTMGVGKVQDERISYTATSKNLEREYLSYSWRTRRGSGEQLTEPEDGNDHLMDAARYGIVDLRKPQLEYGAPRL